MLRPLLSLALAACLLSIPARADLASPPPFAVGVVGTPATGFGDDAVITFGAAPSSANVVIVVAYMDSEGQTMSITDWTDAETTLAGPLDSPSATIRAYVFCTVGDDADTNLTLTTSSSSSVAAFAVELSGTEACADVLREIQTTATSALTTHELGTDLTATAGDFILAAVAVNSGTANFTHNGGFTASIPGADAEVNSELQGQYLLSAAGGAQDTPFTSNVAESCWMMGMALKPSAVAGGFRGGLLLGVGR